MAQDPKTSKSYSLDPDVITWVSQKAAAINIMGQERTNDSKVVNDILRAAMEADEHMKKIQARVTREIKAVTR